MGGGTFWVNLGSSVWGIIEGNKQKILLHKYSLLILLN